MPAVNEVEPVSALFFFVGARRALPDKVTTLLICVSSAALNASGTSRDKPQSLAEHRARLGQAFPTGEKSFG